MSSLIEKSIFHACEYGKYIYYKNEKTCKVILIFDKLPSLMFSCHENVSIICEKHKEVGINYDKYIKYLPQH